MYGNDKMHHCILCFNSSVGVKRKVTFHRFPQLPSRKQQWLDSLNLPSVLDWQRVCSNHFSESDFKPRTFYRRVLWKHAVPKLNDNLIENARIKNTSFTITKHDSAALSNVVYPKNENQKVRKPVNNQILVENLDEMSENMNILRRSSRKIKVKKLDDDFENESPIKLRSNNKASTTVEDTSTKKLSPETKLNNPKVYGGTKCFIKTCSNPSKERLSFFGFPQDPTIRSIWIKNCRLEGIIKLNVKIKRSIKICSTHFEKSMFSNPPRNNRLKPEAVPTIFNNCDVKNTFPIYTENEDINKIDNSPTCNDSMKSEAKEKLQSTPDDIEPSALEDTKNVKVTDNSSTSNCTVNMSSVPKSKSNITDSENDDRLPPPAILLCGLGDPQFVLHKLNNLCWNCPVPGCNSSNITISKNDDTSLGSEYLYSPINDEQVKLWTSIFRIKFDRNTNICYKHFNFDENQISFDRKSLLNMDEQKKIPLEAISMSKEMKTCKEASKRPIDNDENEDLTIKKTKNTLNGESKNPTEHIDLPQNKNIEYCIQPDTNPNCETIDTNSKNSDPIQNTLPSSLEVLPKIVDNNSPTLTMHASVEQCEPVLAIGSTFPASSIEVLNPNPSLPFDETTDSKLKKLLTTASVTNSVSITLEPNSSHYSPPISTQDSLSITLETINRQSDQVSSIDSTNNMIESTGNSNYQKVVLKSEPINSPMSDYDYMPGSSQLDHEGIPPSTQANHNQQMLEEENESMVDSESIDIIKSEPFFESSSLSDDDNSPDYSPQYSEELPLTTTTVRSINYSNTTLCVSNTTHNCELTSSNDVATIIENTQSSCDNHPNEVLESSDDILRTSILPTNSVNHLLKELGPSKLNRLFSRNGCVSISIQNCSKNRSPTTSANNSVGDTSQSHCVQNGQQSATTSKVLIQSATTSNVLDQSATTSKVLIQSATTSNVLDQSATTSKVLIQSATTSKVLDQSATTSKVLDQSSSSTFILKDFPDNQNVNSTSGYKEIPVTANNVSNPINRNETIKKQFIPKNELIRDISKSVMLPSNLWKKTYSSLNNKTMFVELNQFGETTKKVFFKNSLVPEIVINNKYYEYNEAIKTKKKLEELLERIDDVEICCGYDGKYHSDCIGYFEDNTEEAETCHNCKNLSKDDSERYPKKDPLMKNKSYVIKQLQNRIYTLETRVSLARENLRKRIQIHTK